jgi:hypothetical protein
MQGEAMTLKCKKKKRIDVPSMFRFAVMIAALTTVVFARLSYADEPQKTFNTPGEAVNAVILATKNNNDKELLAIFGSASKDILYSGDAVMDEQRREKFLKAYDEKNSLVAEDENMILVIGANDWPYPIPLVKKDNGWFFDTEKGKDEILSRRIGKDELSAVQVCLSIVDAQREYAIKNNNGRGVHEYAQKFISDEGKKNGLYWLAEEGEEPSPLGPAVAKARDEGYKARKPGEGPTPFHGYFYRILEAQGKNAPGGAYEYIVSGRMIGGFAVVAYPDKYGDSGVMTFIVNHDGIVYQKDLGENTGSIAKTMAEYDPDESWKKIEGRVA